MLLSLACMNAAPENMMHLFTAVASFAGCGHRLASN